MVEQVGAKEGRVSVVIPSKDEGGWVKATVEAVLQISGPLLKEVIVVDDASTDGSCDRLEELRGQAPVYVKKTSMGPSLPQAKNLGASGASGDAVVFIDAHSRPGWGWLQEICDVLDMGHAGAALEVVFFDENGELETTWGTVGKWYIAGRSPFNVGHWPANKGEIVPVGQGGCQAFRLEDFHAIGGFCTELSPFGGEDNEICLRVWSRGGTIGAAPGARVSTLNKDWASRPDADTLGYHVWINLAKAHVLHWGPKRLTEMWAAIAEELSGDPDLYNVMWEACHEPRVMELRQQYRAAASRTDDEVFEIFPALSLLEES